MKRGHKVRSHKFSGKSHSAKGIISFMIGLLSISLYVVVIILSFCHQGNGSIYLGSGGVLAFLLGFFSLFLAISSFREQNKYRSYAIAAVIINVLVIIAGITLYMMGI